jgi:hypothetical protein
MIQVMKNANPHSEASPIADTNHGCTRRPLPAIGLSRGRQSVRGYAVKHAIIRLKCETHMSNTEIAEAIGRTRQWVAKVWKAAVREAEQAAIDPENRKELKAWMINQVKMTIIKAQNKVDDHAAYGALVLKGVEQLSALLGMDVVTDSGDKSSLHEIANLFDVRSPLVMAKLGGTKPSESNSKER